MKKVLAITMLTLSLLSYAFATEKPEQHSLAVELLSFDASKTYLQRQAEPSDRGFTQSGGVAFLIPYADTSAGSDVPGNEQNVLFTYFDAKTGTVTTKSFYVGKWNGEVWQTENKTRYRDVRLVKWQGPAREYALAMQYTKVMVAAGADEHLVECVLLFNGMQEIENARVHHAYITDNGRTSVLVIAEKNAFRFMKDSGDDPPKPPDQDAFALYIDGVRVSGKYEDVEMGFYGFSDRVWNRDERIAPRPTPHAVPPLPYHFYLTLEGDTRYDQYERRFGTQKLMFYAVPVK